MSTHRRLFVMAAVAWVASLAGCANAPIAPDAAVQTLAPTGKLRVGLYPGTPTSIVGDPSSGNAKGVGFDLGRDLAHRAGVPFEPVVFANNAEVFAAAKTGSVDMVFTNATPVRRNDLDFSPTVLQVEQGYLVPGKSAIRTLGEIDRAGVRVGVSEGSTSEATLARELHNAVVVRAPSLKAGSTCSPPERSTHLPRTRPRCSKCQLTCRLRASWMATGDWRASPSAFRRAARRRCRLSAASSPWPSPAAPWREPSSERDCGAP